MRPIIILLTLIVSLNAFGQNRPTRENKPTDWAEFHRYENANKEVSKQPLLVLMGDSITDYWVTEDPNFFEKNNYVGRGIAGQTASQMLVRFRQDVLNLNPKAIAIMAGTNDICQQMASMAYYPDENIVGNIIAMCELAIYHKIPVILCAITPCSSYMPIPDLDAGSRIIEINSQLKAYADSQKKIYWLDYFTPLAASDNGLPVNMSYDGVHPTINAYSVMERLLNESVAKNLKVKTPLYSIPQEEADALKKAKDDERKAKNMPLSQKETQERMKNFFKKN